MGFCVGGWSPIHDLLCNASGSAETRYIKVCLFRQQNIRWTVFHSFYSTVSAEEPPMAVVRKFVHLLDQSDQDFQEELDWMKLREEVVTLIRSNQQLENDLNLMDIKIGLLVKNKITLQVLSTYSQRVIKILPFFYTSITKTDFIC